MKFYADTKRNETLTWWAEVVEVRFGPGEHRIGDPTLWAALQVKKPTPEQCVMAARVMRSLGFRRITMTIDGRVGRKGWARGPSYRGTKLPESFRKTMNPNE